MDCLSIFKPSRHLLSSFIIIYIFHSCWVFLFYFIFLKNFFSLLFSPFFVVVVLPPFFYSLIFFPPDMAIREVSVASTSYHTPQHIPP